MWQQSFLYRVYKIDKPFFYFFLIFLIVQFFLTLLRLELTPFFHFGMYSTMHPANQHYTVYSIRVDTTPVRSLDFYDYQREMVYGTISTYDELKENKFHDPLDKFITKALRGNNANIARSLLLNTVQMDSPYQKWLFRYMADMRMVHTPVITVSKLSVRYLPNGTLSPIDSPVTLFKYRDE